jgi:2-oxoisovalerate dehydrogenase E1 component alpha subunit
VSTAVSEPRFRQVPSDAAAIVPAHRQPNDADPQLLQLITPSGERVADAILDPWVSDVTSEALIDLYRDLVVVRRIDTEGVALQRQGELALWPPLLGQEAAQIGSARALRTDDFVFPSYREHGVAYCRGVDFGELLRMWRGVSGSGWNPYDVNMATPAIMIGAQTLHATGYALGCIKDGADSVTVAYFGDGATSQGDVSEAMVFAASFQAPVVFFCQNNHWAISEPVSLQAHRPIADRSPGFGIPSLRVDGNDVLAVLAATRLAADRARSGGGPTFIEAVTYRMGPHTTSDDPSRYVDPAQHAEWAAKDPLARVRMLLEREGVLTAEVQASVDSAADATAHALRQACVALPDPLPMAVFDHVFTQPTAWLQRQAREYAAYLAMFEDGPVDGPSVDGNAHGQGAS